MGDASVKIALLGFIVVLIVLWVLTIIWVSRDAEARGAAKTKWTIIAIIPFLGALIYCAMRPPMLLSDKEDLDLDNLIKRRMLLDYGECSRCGYPVEKEFIMCPNCGAQLKNICGNCGKPLKPEWSHCPYCCSPCANRNADQRAAARRQHQGQTQMMPQSQSQPQQPQGEQRQRRAMRRSANNQADSKAKDNAADGQKRAHRIRRSKSE